MRTFEADFRLTTNGIVDVETIFALDDSLAKSERGLNPLPIVSPETEGIGYVPPSASAALLNGLDFSNGTGDKGKRYRAAYAAADADSRLAKGDPSNCKALLQFPKAVFFEAKMAICAEWFAPIKRRQTREHRSSSWTTPHREEEPGR